MGSDSSIVQAARVSYGKGTKKLREDEGLIRYLVRHHHTSPLEMCELKLHIRVPMDCWRQWIRHRTASINEYSTGTRLQSMPRKKRHRMPGVCRLSATAKGAKDFSNLIKANYLRHASASCMNLPVRSITSASKPALPANRHARIYRSAPIPKHTGKPICIIFCIFLRCGWTAMRSWKSAPMQRRSGTKLSAGGVPWYGRVQRLSVRCSGIIKTRDRYHRTLAGRRHGWCSKAGNNIRVSAARRRKDEIQS